MSSRRRLAILAQAGTPEGVAVGYRGLTHHEAATLMHGLVERRVALNPQPSGLVRYSSRYYLTEQGKRYLAVMQVPAGVPS